jgi:hypothetical protein
LFRPLKLPEWRVSLLRVIEDSAGMSSVKKIIVLQSAQKDTLKFVDLVNKENLTINISFSEGEI